MILYLLLTHVADVVSVVVSVVVVSNVAVSDFVVDVEALVDDAVFLVSDFCQKNQNF